MIYINDFSRKFEIDLYSICENSPYGARIISYHTAYHGKKYDFLDFWLQRDNGEAAVCAFCKYYSTLIICGNPCDVNELDGFVKMVLPSNILCGSELSLDCEMSLKTGETMSCDRLCLPNCTLNPDYKISKLSSDMNSLRKVYSLLSEENGETHSLTDFESYFIDMSHRIRHGVSKVYAVTDRSGGIISTATVLAVSKSSSVVGCVATSNDYRKQGLATALVKFITEKELSHGRTVFLHRERDIRIYEKIGYKTVGYWSEYVRKP